MAKASGDIDLSLEFPDLTQLREELKAVPKNIAAKHLLAALRIAMKPAMEALKRNTPKGPTGNLRKSIAFKGVKYTKDGNAVGMVGYQWRRGATNDPNAKGNHQGWIEFGIPRVRTLKSRGRIASSFRYKLDKAGKGRGDFRIVTPARGKNAGKLKTINPSYPKSFFKSAKAGQQVQLGKMPIGGRTGRPPVKTSFREARPAMVTLLRMELGKRLEKALAEAKGRAARGLIT